MNRQLLASALGGGISTPVASPQGLKTSQNAEVWLAKQLGATPEELQQIKTDNRAEKGSGLLRTGSSGEGGIYDEINKYMDSADSYRDRFDLAGRTGDSDGREMGFGNGQLVKAVYAMENGNPQAHIKPVMNMLNFADKYEGKDITEAELPGKIKQNKAGEYFVRKGYNSGENDKNVLKYYFTKNEDGTFSSKGFGYHKDNIKSGGGFFSSTLGQIAMVGLSIWGGGALAAMWGGGTATLGSSIAAGAAIGGGSAALTGGDIGKGILGGAIGGGLGFGLESVNPSTTSIPSAAGNATVRNWGATLANGAVKGGVSSLINGGNPVAGVVGGAAGAGIGGYVGDTTGVKSVGSFAGSVAGSEIGGMVNTATADQATSGTKSNGGLHWAPMNNRQRLAALL